MADDSKEDSEEKGKGGLMKILIPVGIGVVALAIGAGAMFFVLNSKLQEVEEALAQKEEEMTQTTAKTDSNRDALYQDLDPVFTVNIEGDNTEHYLTLGISVMSFDQGSYEAVQLYRPIIRDSLLIMLSDANFEELLSPEGKEALRVKVKETIVEVLDDNQQLSDVEDVYFTKFLMQ